MSNINLYDFIDEIQDFPKKGILFRDISPLLENKDAFKLLILKMLKEINNYKIDLIAGIDARGFLFSTILAHQLKVGSIMIRKPNKLPGFWPTDVYVIDVRQTLKNNVVFIFDSTYLRIRCEIPGNLPTFSVRYTLRYVKIDKFHRSITKVDT